MRNRRCLALGCGALAVLGALALVAAGQETSRPQDLPPDDLQLKGVRSFEVKAETSRDQAPPPDAVAEAQTPREVPSDRPEQKQTEHDRSEKFFPPNVPPSSKALEDQPEQGRMKGFDFARDSLGA